MALAVGFFRVAAARSYRTGPEEPLHTSPSPAATSRAQSSSCWSTLTGAPWVQGTANEGCWAFLVTGILLAPKGLAQRLWGIALHGTVKEGN